MEFDVWSLKLTKPRTSNLKPRTSNLKPQTSNLKPSKGKLIMNKTTNMKSIFLSGLLLLCLNGMSQNSAISDPALGRITLSGQPGQVLNADKLPLDQVFSLRLPITNVNNGKMLPAGSCKIKLGFGSKLAIDPGFSVVAADMNEYFSWSASMEGGQLQLTGDLINPLPTGLTTTGVTLRVKGTAMGTSTITANFLVSNHRTGITLSDSDPTNNSTYLQYTITGKQTPGIIKISNAQRSSCRVNVSFTNDKEVNLSRYDIEASRDGFNYTKVGEVAATGANSYTTGFDLTDAIKATDIFVRIRAVSVDGDYQFSSSRVVSGSCDKDVNPWVLNVYPNPATDVKAVTISAKEGIFKGKYKVTILDMDGRLAQVKEVQLDNVQQFSYNLGTLGAGKYLIQVMNSDGTQSSVLQFEKL